MEKYPYGRIAKLCTKHFNLPPPRAKPQITVSILCSVFVDFPTNLTQFETGLSQLLQSNRIMIPSGKSTGMNPKFGRILIVGGNHDS